MWIVSSHNLERNNLLISFYSGITVNKGRHKIKSHWHTCKLCPFLEFSQHTQRKHPFWSLMGTNKQGKCSVERFCFGWLNNYYKGLIKPHHCKIKHKLRLQTALIKNSHHVVEVSTGELFKGGKLWTIPSTTIYVSTLWVNF